MRLSRWFYTAIIAIFLCAKPIFVFALDPAKATLVFGVQQPFYFEDLPFTLTVSVPLDAPPILTWQSSDGVSHTVLLSPTVDALTYIGVLSIPASTPLGNIRMAVKLHQAGDVTSTDLDGTTQFLLSGRQRFVISNDIESDLSVPPDSTVIILGSVQIKNEAKIVLGAGSVIKMGASSSFSSLIGNIEAHGTAASPVIFTSIYDNASDGFNSTLPLVTGHDVRPDFWASIQMGNQSSFERTYFQYLNRVVGLSNSSATFSSCIFQNMGTLDLSENAFAFLKGCSFLGVAVQDYGANRLVAEKNIFIDVPVGLALSESVTGRVAENSFKNCSAIGLDLNAQDVAVKNNTFVNCDVAIRLPSQVTAPISNNSFQYTKTACLQLPPKFTLPQLESNTFYSSPAPFLLIAGDLLPDEAAVWDFSGSPLALGNINLKNNSTLTVKAGSILKGGHIFGEGKVSLLGEPSKPVVLTSIQDDSWGGDTDQNGTTSVSKGSGVSISASIGKIQNAIIRYSDGIVSNNPTLSSISDSLIEYTNTSMVFNAPQVDILHSTIQYGQAPLTIINGANVLIKNNWIHNNLNAGVSIVGTKNVVFDNNLISENTEGLKVGARSLQDAVSAITLNNNTFANNHIPFINFVDFTIKVENISSNVFIPSTATLFCVADTFELSGSAHIQNIGMPYLFLNLNTVSPGFSIDPGTILKFSPGAGLELSPGVVLSGTDSNPLVFTTFEDDKYGGDTNQDGIRIPTRRWGGVNVTSNEMGVSSGSIQHALIRYADVVAPYNIGNSTIQSSVCGLNVSYTSSVTVENVSFIDNMRSVCGDESFGFLTHFVEIHNSQFSLPQKNNFFLPADFIVDARNNWWGDSSGPKDISDDRATGGYYNPDGRGIPIENQVAYNPWTGATRFSPTALKISEGVVVSSSLIHVEVGLPAEASAMIISTDAYFAGANWTALQARAEMNLPSRDGNYAISAQFAAPDGSVSPIITTPVILRSNATVAIVKLSSNIISPRKKMQVTLEVNKPLKQTPSLSAQLQNNEPLILTLTKQNDFVYTADLIIPSVIPGTLLKFYFQGESVDGELGTEIVTGAAFNLEVGISVGSILNEAVMTAHGRIFLSWDGIGEGNLSYGIFRSNKPDPVLPDDYVNVATVTATQYYDGPLAVDDTYHYSIQTRSDNGDEATFSNVLSTTSDSRPPEAPAFVKADIVGEKQIRVSWTASGGPEAPFYYKVYRKPVYSDPSENARAPLAFLKSTTDTQIVDQVPGSGNYYYGVSALDEVTNESSISTSAIVTIDDFRPYIQLVTFNPPSPVGLSEVKISLFFSESISSVAVPIVMFHAANSDVDVPVAGTMVNPTFWEGKIQLSKATPEGTAILWVSQAKDLSGLAMNPYSYSFEIDVTAPPQVTNLSAADGGVGTDVVLTWKASDSRSSFEVWRSTLPTMESTQKVADHVLTASFADSPFDATTVWYQVREKDAAGNEGPLSTIVSVDLPLKPMVVSPIAGARLPSTQVQVQGRAQSHCTIDVWLDGKLATSTHSADNLWFAALVSDVTEGDHLLQVRSRDIFSHESALSTGTLITIDFLPDAPPAPTAETGDTVITLTWQPSAGNDVVGYNIYRDGNTVPLNVALIRSSGDVSFQDTGLTNGRLYRYHVAAVDAAGQLSGFSNDVTAIPQAGTAWGGQ